MINFFKKNVKWISIVLIILLVLVGLISFIWANEDNSDAINKDLDEIIDSEFNSESFNLLSIDEQKDKIQNLLYDQYKKGNLQEEPIYDAQSKSFSFIYSNGHWGGLSLAEFNSDYNGINENTISNNQEYYSANVQKAYADSNKTMKILYSFPDSEGIRKKSYGDFEKKWNSLGLHTTVDWYATIEDFTNLKGNDAIMISMHGGIYPYGHRPILATNETVSHELNKKYVNDLDNHLIADYRWTSTAGETKYNHHTYIIFPEFFGSHYNNNELSNMCVLSDSCDFLGENSTPDINKCDLSFPNNFAHGGSSCVLGYQNSVINGYSIKVEENIISKMITDNLTIKEALDDSKKQFGNNDKEKLFKDKEKPPASMYLFGDKNFTLSNSEREEDDPSSTSWLIGKWSTSDGWKFTFKDNNTFTLDMGLGYEESGTYVLSSAVNNSYPITLNGTSLLSLMKMIYGAADSNYHFEILKTNDNKISLVQVYSNYTAETSPCKLSLSKI